LLLSSAAAPRVTPGKVIEEKDNLLHFSGEAKDWPPRKGSLPRILHCLHCGGSKNCSEGDLYNLCQARLGGPQVGLKSVVFHEYVSIRKPLEISRVHTSHVGVSQRSPSLPLQCRQCRIRGRDMVPDMHVGCGFFFVLVDEHRRTNLVRRS